MRLNFRSSIIVLVISTSVLGCQQSCQPQAPTAQQRSHTHEMHGDQRPDPYFWMSKRDDPKVLAYLNAENNYTELMMRSTEGLQKNLVDEMKARIQEQDDSAPVVIGPYSYYQRYDQGKEYPSIYRKETSGTEERMLLDVNELAKSHKYFHLAAYKISPDHHLLAFAFDTQGRRKFNIRVRDLRSGEDLDFEIKDSSANFIWAEDNKTLYFVKQHPETLRSDTAYRRSIDQKQEERVYYEEDDTFSVYLHKGLARKLVWIVSHSTLTTEYRMLDTASPEPEIKVFAPRQRGVEYYVEEGDSVFFVRTNLDAPNFRLMQTSPTQTSMESWKPFVDHDPKALLEDVLVLKDVIVLQQLAEGLARLRVIDRHSANDSNGKGTSSSRHHDIAFLEPSYYASLGTQYEYDSPTFRYNYESLQRPRSHYDYDWSQKSSQLIKAEVVLGDFDPDQYRSERWMVPSHDGTEVPMSVVYRADLDFSHSHPTLIYGYGSYGISMPANFSRERLSLLDRGFIFAIAHVRGGSEMGRSWYESGKLLNKKNTFEDFIACSRALIQKGWTTPEQLFAMGRSAGGLLMGAVANMRPELYRGIIAGVPFVDVLTTMLDDSIPLTTSEYDEWGNPQDPDFYHYIKSYSPYDQIKEQAYPHMLITSGYHDSQVQYWEPAKWTAALRQAQTGDGLILLKMDMEVGHSGTTGRYKRLEQSAFEYAFMLNLLSKSD